MKIVVGIAIALLASTVITLLFPHKPEQFTTDYKPATRYCTPQDDAWFELDEKAEISNDTNRSRAGSESLAVPELFGLPQRAGERLPEGASLDDAVSIDSASVSKGKGSVKRKEKLTLRVAATVVDVLPNGVLSISGSQELRVNFELRELLVSGYVRPEDISRQNEITYDKIASARVSYGGRGQITDVQQPRYGQQILDTLLPF